MIFNSIWWGGSSSWDLQNVESSFIAITKRQMFENWREEKIRETNWERERERERERETELEREIRDKRDSIWERQKLGRLELREKCESKETGIERAPRDKRDTNWRGQNLGVEVKL